MVSSRKPARRPLTSSERSNKTPDRDELENLGQRLRSRGIAFTCPGNRSKAIVHRQSFIPRIRAESSGLATSTSRVSSIRPFGHDGPTAGARARTEELGYQSASSACPCSIAEHYVPVVHGAGLERVRDLRMTHAAIMYSWPSAGSEIQYIADANAAEQSAPHLRQFLERVAERTGAKRIHRMRTAWERGRRASH